LASSNLLSGYLSEHGVSRRAFLKQCILMTSLLGLAPRAAGLMAARLGSRPRQPVVWLSFQECTGCTESLTRSNSPSIETLIFDFYSLDYHHTLQAASGAAAEAARLETVAQGGHLLVVDGSVPLGHGGGCSTIAGHSNLETLAQSLANAQAVIAVGSCAAFGGLPAAQPNPTGAVSVEQLMESGRIAQRPLVNLPGCPPLPEAIAATLAHYVTFGRFPVLDSLHRPNAIYGNTVHDRCPRIGYFYAGKFARSFDDEGARQGWCLYELGCKGPVTHNACSTLKWNAGTSSPVDSGHPCIGCSEPGFWDTPGLYRPLAAPAEADTGARSEAAQRGQVLYEDNCVYCHEPGGADLPRDAEAVPGAYAQRGGRAHRVQLGAQEWADLVEYLKGESR
jgi:hydrogenase small subunit